jgi:hypothetical protein
MKYLLILVPFIASCSSEIDSNGCLKEEAYNVMFYICKGVELDESRY